MPGAGAAAVFPEADIKAPVKLVFHAPVPAHGAREAPDVRREAAEVVAAFGARGAAGDFAHGFDEAHAAEVFPLGAVGEPAEVAALPVAPDFDSAVAFFERLHFHQTGRGAQDRVVEEGAQKDLDAGKLHFALHGGKLEGEWTLVRIKHAGDNEWLLIKSGDDARVVSRKKDDESALTGRSMARIAKERTAEWRAGREEAAAKLEFIAPMKATLVAEPPTQGEWLYELKFDGYRALALKNGGEVQLLSSNAKDFSARFAEIAEAVAALSARTAIFDGEMVALDEEGRSSFQMLQALEADEKRPPLVFYIFDLLHHDGTDLLDQSLHERRKRLSALLKRAAEPLRCSAEIRGDPERLLDEVRQRGIEGIIGEERESRYEPGRRSRSWIKLKCVAEQEMVIGGYTPPEGTRKHFGALLVGYYRGKELQFAGKVGSGFDAALLKSLHQKMCALHRADCPFANLPEKQPGRWRQNITPREMKRCHWIKSELVCQVRFGEWTCDGKLRHPVFLGLREDKDAREVIRETPR